jgi:hypothetical protein
MFYISYHECNTKIKKCSYEISDTDNPLIKYWRRDNGFDGYGGRMFLYDLSKIEKAVSILNPKDLYAIVPPRLHPRESHGKGVNKITVKRRDLDESELEKLAEALDGKKVTIRISREGKVFRKRKF